MNAFGNLTIGTSDKKMKKDWESCKLISFPRLTDNSLDDLICTSTEGVFSLGQGILYLSSDRLGWRQQDMYIVITSGPGTLYRAERDFHWELMYEQASRDCLHRLKCVTYVTYLLEKFQQDALESKFGLKATKHILNLKESILQFFLPTFLPLWSLLIEFCFFLRTHRLQSVLLLDTKKSLQPVGRVMARNLVGGLLQSLSMIVCRTSSQIIFSLKIWLDMLDINGRKPFMLFFIMCSYCLKVRL